VINHDTTKQTLRRMLNDNQLDTDGQGRYFLPAALSPLSPLSLAGDTSDSSDTSPHG
jgi:hypothetical protein